MREHERAVNARTVNSQTNWRNQYRVDTRKSANDARFSQRASMVVSVGECSVPHYCGKLLL
jgi:hypothetical protein